MATDRRKFLSLLALGVPATTRAMRQDSTPAIPSRALIDEDGEYESAFLMELVPGVRQRLWDAFLGRDLSMRVVRNAPGDCPPGKIRWAIEVEESDGRSESVLNKHPNVLLVNGSKSLLALYTICLEQTGCRVESAPDNDAAMRLYRDHGPYDLVLTHLFHFTEVSKRIRERNPEQAIAIVGACNALSVRFHHKVPVLREGFRQARLVRLVESAIKPRVRILLVGEEYCHLWDFVMDNVASFELEVESNGEDGLRRYRECGPYDIVLTRSGFVPSYLPRSRQGAGMNGSDLALAIRSENSAQRIAMIPVRSFATVRRSIQRKLGDIPVLRGEEVFDAMKELRYERQPPDGGEWLLASVDRVIAVQTKRKQAAKEPCILGGDVRA